MTFTVEMYEDSPEFKAADNYLYHKYDTTAMDSQIKEWKEEFEVDFAWLQSDYVRLTFPSEQHYIAWLLRWG